DADLVAGVDGGRAVDLAAVKKRAVLGGHVVNLNALGGVNDDGAMPTGQVRVGDDHVVIGKPAYSVDAHAKAVDGVFFDEHVLLPGGHPAGSVYVERFAAGGAGANQLG